MACFDLKGRFCLAFKNFLCKIAQKFYCIYLRKTPALFIGRKVMAQSRILRSDFSVSNLPVLFLSKIGKISKIIKNPKNIRFVVE